MKAIYNTVRDVYNGDCFIPLNKRGTKDPKKLGCGNVICEAGLAMHRSVANLNTIAHIALLSIAIAAVITKKDCSVRSRKALFRSA